jgi:CPA2 family monovalent cation:H+ antiporter-2
VLVAVVGRRVVPWLLEHVARLRSRELFTLAVLAIALGIAYGAARFTGASMALGAFLAGMVVGQTDLSLEAAADALPLRDAFAVLFFVSVGMLFDPTLILRTPGLLLATLGLVLVVKPAVALVLVLAFGHPLRAALTVAVGLAQIGEFSFILAALGRELGLLPEAGQSVILAVALVSIALNPLLFRLVGPLDSALRSSPRLARLLAGRRPAGGEPHGHADHVVICGYGRVGLILRELLTQRGQPFVVIEHDRRLVAALRREGLTVVSGDAGNPIVLDHAGIAHARVLVLGLADPVATRLAVDHALAVNDTVRILARAGSDTEERTLLTRGRVGAVVGEREAALELARLYLLEEGVGAIESEALLMDLRRSEGAAPRSAGTRLIEVKVAQGSRAVGKRLRQVGLPASIRVVMIDREGQYQVAHGTTIVAAGDRLLVLADEDGLAALERLLAPS